MPNTKKILIIDDHELVLLGLRSALQSNRDYIIVAEAANGKEGLEYINQNSKNVDIVITDVSMPILGGIELCKKIKNDFSNILVVLYSINDSFYTFQEAIEAKANGFIKKNSSKDELLHSLAIVVEKGTNFKEKSFFEYNQELRREQLKPKLSTKEKQILDLIVKDYTSEEIAQTLHLSKKTIDIHRGNMLQKFDCKSTLALVLRTMHLYVLPNVRDN